MATVDFTKDELLADMKAMIQPMIEESAEDVKESIRAELNEGFMSFVEHNFNPAIDSLQEQISEVRQDMKKMRVVVD